MATVPSKVRHRRILEELNKKYSNWVAKKELREALGEEMTEDVLVRDITYLKEKGLVVARGDWLFRITSRGIDFLEGT